MKKATLLLLAATSLAQNVSQSIAPSITIGGSAIQNPTALATPFVLNVEDLWDLFVGPVEEASTTTTVAPTPIPSESLIPPPPLYYSPFPTGQQVPRERKNESWSFPKDFWYVHTLEIIARSNLSNRWGVAGAAYQVEGAAKDEGRGPSVWDVLSHRVTNYILDNQTADVTDVSTN